MSLVNFLGQMGETYSFKPYNFNTNSDIGAKLPLGSR